MGYTLDQLLEATGVDELAGTQFKKVAAPDKPDLLKLAARCREAAEGSNAPSLPPDDVVAANQALVEKTAAVEIIRRTIAEIREIEGSPPGATKLASPRTTDGHAAFIKKALEEGHSPESIATFLEQLEDQPEKPKKKLTQMIG